MKTGPPLSPLTVPPSSGDVGTVRLKTLSGLLFGIVELGFNGSRNWASRNGWVLSLTGGTTGTPATVNEVAKAPNSMFMMRRLLSKLQFKGLIAQDGPE